jgi:hypothetical protein
MNKVFYNNLNSLFLNTLSRNCTEDDYYEFYKQFVNTNNFNNIKELLTCNYVFVPRDSGFFSVFNYLIGLIYYGYKIYPYWNKDVCLSKNKQLRHFCYFNLDVENSWFEYFEPIKYFEDDNNNYNCLHFKLNQGYNTPKEFKFIDYRRNFSKNKDFNSWRYKVNLIYKKYIKPLPIITNQVDEICKDFKNTIAVHYRHPSHSCEQGQVYFDDYFIKIDKLLLESPDSMIFLATDNDLGILMFCNKYKEKIIYRKEVDRTSVDNILDWAYASSIGKTDHLGFINNIGYQIHYDSVSSIKLGHDVLIDTLCICRCNTFVHTISNIAFAVSYINPDIDMVSIATNN